MSTLSILLSEKQGRLLSPYWIADDETYICTEKKICPWPGRNLSVEKDSSNYWQSSARIFIEQAFGILIARRGKFLRPLRLDVGKAAQVVSACCKLHNFIIDICNETEIPMQSGVDNESERKPRDPSVYLQQTCYTHAEQHHRRRELEYSHTRASMTD